LVQLFHPFPFSPSKKKVSKKANMPVTLAMSASCNN
jgi:hypothetical protein